MRKRGFTLIELLVVIAIIAMLMAILMPALSKVKKIAMRVVCGTNLKGLGTAQTVYANDYDDEYAVQGRGAQLQWQEGTLGFQNPALNWNVDATTITIGASLYLLVREADVSPKSFVCPAGDEVEYDGTNTNNLDIVELWDFGYEDLAAGSGYPRDHVSYSYHQPYGSNGAKSRYAADGTRSAAFAMMADKNPYFDPKMLDTTANGANPNADNWTDYVRQIAPYWQTGSSFTESSWEVKAANAVPHDRDGQNVLYADGHTAYENVTDVGIKHDQIYIFRNPAQTTEQAIRQGNWPAITDPTYDLSYQPAGSEDTYLVNDDVGAGN